jgi:hypothetical protein
MLIGEVRPTTIDGVKSLARQLRKAAGVKYSVALNQAAEAAGCSNYRNAQHALPARRSELESPYILLTTYWCDKDQGWQVGRETLRIELSKPVLEICSKSALRMVRGFGDLRMVAVDHFVCDTIAETQISARDGLCKAERSLRFMEQTGLIASTNYRKAYPDRTFDSRLPQTDHPTDWLDPESGQFIIIDEPYSGAPDDAEREAWANRNGWRVIKTSWPGMYNPYHCDLYVVTDGRSGYDVDSLVAIIDAMPPPLIVKNWCGESSPSWDTFVSPMATTFQDVRRARCKGTIYPKDSPSTVPYRYSAGSARRRPNAKLGIPAHIEAGRIIKALIWSRHRPWGVKIRMESLRCTLEDWMSLELRRGELEGPEFFDVYYHDSGTEGADFELAQSASGNIEMLEKLKTMLQAAYPDCAPLRQQVRRIDMSVKMIRELKSEITVTQLR